MNCNYGLAIILMCFGWACTGPSPAGKPEVSPGIIPATATIDNFGHIYYATGRQEVYKVNATGDSLAYYSNNRLGAISIIDVTNPLKVLVYFPDFFTGIFLDRQLNETSSFDMIELGFGQITVVGAALDGALWIFDDHQQRVSKIDPQGKVLRRGEDLRLLFNERLLPNRIVEVDGQVFVQVPGRGILRFDLFGQYIDQMLIEDIEYFQVMNGIMFYQRESGPEWMDLATRVSQRFPVQNMKLTGKMLWISAQEFTLVDREGVQTGSFSQ